MADPLIEGPKPTVPTGRVPIFTSLRYREYRLFWVGAAFSNLGIWVLMTGHLWLMHSLTESAFMLGLLTMSSSGPILLFSMWGGVVADRVNRLKLVTYTRSIFAALSLITAAIIYYDLIQPWHIIVLSFTYGILVAFDIPCRQAIVPNLVRTEHLLNAIVLYSFLMGGANVIGPTIFGPLVRLLGMEGLFLFVGTSYVATVLALLRMRPVPHFTKLGTSQPWEDLLKGLVYIRDHRSILILILTGVTTGIFGSSFGTLMPIFASRFSEGNVQGYGYLLLSSGIGGLLGMGLLAAFGNLKHSLPIQILAGIGFGLSLATFSQIAWFPGSLAAISLVGGLSVVFGTVNNTLVQTLVADEFRGRVMSIHQLGWGANAIGGLMMGSMAETISAPMTLSICGMTTAIITGILTTSAARTISLKTNKS